MGTRVYNSLKQGYDEDGFKIYHDEMIKWVNRQAGQDKFRLPKVGEVLPQYDWEIRSGELRRAVPSSRFRANRNRNRADVEGGGTH